MHLLAGQCDRVARLFALLDVDHVDRILALRIGLAKVAWLVRISAEAYTDLEQCARLAQASETLLASGESSRPRLRRCSSESCCGGVPNGWGMRQWTSRRPEKESARTGH